jgi:hypothetical protein
LQKSQSEVDGATKLDSTGATLRVPPTCYLATASNRVRRLRTSPEFDGEVCWVCICQYSKYIADPESSDLHLRAAAPVRGLAWITVANVNALYQLTRKIYNLRAGFMCGCHMWSTRTLTTFLEVSDLKEFKIKSAKLSAQPIKSLDFSDLDISDTLQKPILYVCNYGFTVSVWPI